MTGTGTGGTGPGEIAADGSAVEFYAAMPFDERSAALVHGAVPPGTAILELGAGAGRVTAPLLALGHPVTAVDGSPGMLAHIEGARTVCSAIEDLDLPDRFGCVLMMSYLVNYGDREALLATCRRHAAPGGLVIFQRETAGWDEGAPRAWSHDGIDFRLTEVEPRGPGVVAATIEYRMGGRRWTHSFVSRRLGDDALPPVLEAAGLRFDRFLDDAGAWVAARPV
ncbi:class I SAM-dependent methyltransferase [Actinomadura graeca]|uniref:Class I SAM-dependent methyltransferase n=1 Tax=Actinomadura graeca TaxID=2750812 RepID=A0ABX8QMB8_9ACTN|nr:class I SAM-dependent methyltransferase [Actinomadura graeca]QXJ19870.1 class I SAM-dependent methyltransferase [Actinomadura graeca]